MELTPEQRDERDLWDLDEKDGSLTYGTAELSMLAQCFPQFDLEVKLPLAIFTALLWETASYRCQHVDDAESITAEDREKVNAVVDLWRKQIELVQAKVDALPIYAESELEDEPQDVSRWPRRRLLEEVKRLRGESDGQETAAP
jgi:hypothetical protein